MLENPFLQKLKWTFLMLGLIVSGNLFAAQDSTIVIDNAPVRVEPKPSAKVLEYVAVGMEVRVSSFPLEGGWYKIRSKTGVYGWIQQKYLSVYKPEEDSKPEVEVVVKGPKPERDRKWYLRGFGGFDFFRVDDLNDLFDFTDLNTGYMFGGELGVFLSDRFAVSLRTEAILKDLAAQERVSGLFFNMAVRSYPVMGGLDFYFIKLPPVRVSAGVFGGLALATSFSAQANSLPYPNTVVLQRSPFTSLVRLNVTRPLGRVLSIFTEVGYRYLRSEEIDTTGAAGINGGQQLMSKNGIYKNRAIDLSGFILSVGMGLHF